ncbi:MAG: metal-binding protein [Rhodobacteraceae bacterium CG17_big_fil_post_rev_8_21_14_2_50_65_11]|nr:MAG: metal-binding protein [Rhodobacteraceae bacterium CG17_big_fil_post_rev_8_21_14_2_50_65_11]
MGAPHWLALFAVILAAWAILYMMSAPADLRDAGQVYGAAFWRELCTLTPDAAGFLKMALMWALMSAAMMAPTALPAFATYEDLASTGASTRFGALVAGYLSVWLGFSGLAAATQVVLYGAGLLDPFGTSTSAALSAGLLAMAGVYQFTPLKDACLSKCRMPLTFFMQHWDEGALRNGLRLGAVCLGCCWALMALAFVGGVMSLGFMALATVLMVLEKLPEIGRWLTRPLGIALLGGAGVVALNGL